LLYENAMNVVIICYEEMQQQKKFLRERERKQTKWRHKSLFPGKTKQVLEKSNSQNQKQTGSVLLIGGKLIRQSRAAKLSGN